MNPLSAQSIVETLGLVGVFMVLLAETALLIGLILPGDSLLFVAGVAASGVAMKAVGVQLSLPVLMIGAPIAAIVGSQVGRNIGEKLGRPLFARPDGRIFSQDRVKKTEDFLARYGYAKALILARFVPVVRTFINPIAGVIGMPKATFLKWNVISAILWTESVIILGYLLGEKLKGSIDKYLLPIVAVVIVISILPLLLGFIKERKNKS